MRGHIRCCCDGFLRFRPYGGSPFPDAGVPAQRKGNPKGFALTFGPLAGARGSFAPGSIRGIDFGLLRCTSFRCSPRMNPCTQPPDGPSRSRAALELTLIVLSGEERCGWIWFCGGFAPHRNAARPALSRGRGGRFLGFSKSVFDSVSHVDISLPNNAVSPLSPRERARVRAAMSCQTHHSLNAIPCFSLVVFTASSTASKQSSR